jgi:hypothetical protein
MNSHCCESMREQVEFTCEQHASRFDCPDALIGYLLVLNEYGLIVHDGGTSAVNIAFCPWCGTKLPESLRERWFTELAALGFDEPLVQDIPERYKSDEWYRAA